MLSINCALGLIKNPLTLSSSLWQIKNCFNWSISLPTWTMWNSTLSGVLVEVRTEFIKVGSPGNSVLSMHSAMCMIQGSDARRGVALTVVFLLPFTLCMICCFSLMSNSMSSRVIHECSKIHILGTCLAIPQIILL